MHRKSYLLLSTAVLAGCAVSDLPLIEQAESIAVVVPERNTPAGQLQTLDEFASLERDNALETAAPQTEQAEAAPAIPRPAAPSQTPVAIAPVASVVADPEEVSDGPLIMAASEEATRTEGASTVPMVVADTAEAEIDLNTAGRTGADALTAAQTRYEPSVEVEPVIVAEAAEAPVDADGPGFFETSTEEEPAATPITEEQPSAPVIMADATVAAEGRTGADALTAAQARYVPTPAVPEAEELPTPAEQIVEAETVTQPSIITGAAAPRIVASANGTVETPDGEVSQLLAAERAVEAINAYRAENGLTPLVYNDGLSEVARAHVVDLAARGEVSALNREGQGIGERLKNAGYAPKAAGSLVSGGYATIEAALESWQKNTVQNSRLLMESADEIGFAIISDRTSTYGIYIETIISGS